MAESPRPSRGVRQDCAPAPSCIMHADHVPCIMQAYHSTHFVTDCVDDGDGFIDDDDGCGRDHNLEPGAFFMMLVLLFFPGSPIRLLPSTSNTHDTHPRRALDPSLPTCYGRLLECLTPSIVITTFTPATTPTTYSSSRRHHHSDSLLCPASM